MEPFHGADLLTTFEDTLSQMRWDEVEVTIEEMEKAEAAAAAAAEALLTEEPVDSLSALLLPPAEEPQPVQMWFPSMDQADVSTPTPGTSAGSQQPVGQLETKKRKAKTQLSKKQAKKRPPNAFHFFAREQRRAVEMEYNITNGAIVNRILGDKWHALTTEEQVPYRMKASLEEDSHPELYDT